jgi:hypothetical protein
MSETWLPQDGAAVALRCISSGLFYGVRSDGEPEALTACNSAPEAFQLCFVHKVRTLRAKPARALLLGSAKREWR